MTDLCMFVLWIWEGRTTAQKSSIDTWSTVSSAQVDIIILKQIYLWNTNFLEMLNCLIVAETNDFA